MVEKVGFIKNPLTIIAIFAGIAEVSGTVVLPFVPSYVQMAFVYFLIGFPSLLVLLFFVTLNFNNKVLYAPSDYKDEENYFRVFKYDANKQERVSVSIQSEDKNALIRELQESNVVLMSRIEAIETRYSVAATIVESQVALENIPIVLYVSNMRKAKEFVSKMALNGYDFNIYRPTFDDDSDTTFENNSAIWLGRNVPFMIARDVIAHSKLFYRHLQYIHISQGGPPESDNEIFVGGWTPTARDRYGLRPLTQVDFQRIAETTDVESLHAAVRRAYPT